MEFAKFEGFSDLDQALAELPKATAKNVLKRTLTKGAETVREAWEPTVVVRTGHYQRSIIVGPGSKLTPRQKRDAKADGPFFAEMHVGSSDPAAQQEEFGNSHQPPHPTAGPAWDATKDGVLEGIGKDLAEEIEKARARLARKAARLAGSA